MKNKIIIALILLVFSNPFVFSQRFGVQFQFYMEPNENDTFYVNVLPLLYEMELTEKISFKVGSLFSLRFSDDISIGNVGLSFTLPYYLSDSKRSMDGFFLAPNIMTTYNVTTNEIVLTEDLEIGYSLITDTDMSWVFGTQLGVSHLIGKESLLNVFHFGPIIHMFF